MIAIELLRKYPIKSDQVTLKRLEVVLSELEKVLQQYIPGDIVEFGCYIGTTSLFLRRLLDAYGQSESRELHVYDSFEGLPEKSGLDSSPAGEQFKAGELSVGKKQLLHEFKKANLRPPVVHKGWFNELSEKDVPQHIAFAFLDGDFYESIRDSLGLVWPALDPHGVITIDDYGREALPGVERAVREFLLDKPSVREKATNNIAIISK
ncbi:MAG TPA: TylF/MycF/NovP-related O-methyltransferase [Candidatus Saccharimonadales bacterium]|nr:TylF/MycF/NovP-related O-methyltransferase [Candidatus Saccharimonadales bacterium]